MKEDSYEDVTRLINRCNTGDQFALDELVTQVYAELTQKAHWLMRRERPGSLLQTTGLVHETYIRLIELGKIKWQSRGHFFAVVIGVMRRILVDQARCQLALKRGGGETMVTLQEDYPAPTSEQSDVDILALNAALQKLSQRDERLSQIVELRFFAGLGVEEVAKVLSLSPATVKRKWIFARTLLYRDLNPIAA